MLYCTHLAHPSYPQISGSSLLTLKYLNVLPCFPLISPVLQNVLAYRVQRLIHDNVPIHQSSHSEVIIQLPHIIDVSQLKLKSKPFVLCLTTCDNRRYQISLPNTSDLQRWCHFIASRSRRARISDPERFEFHVHVSWDSKSHAFVVSKRDLLLFDDVGVDFDGGYCFDLGPS